MRLLPPNYCSTDSFLPSVRTPKKVGVLLIQSTDYKLQIDAISHPHPPLNNWLDGWLVGVLVEIVHWHFTRKRTPLLSTHVTLHAKL